MAEPNPSPVALSTSPTPALASTADTVPYVPVSWMAVGSIMVAALFVLVLGGYGLYAFLGKKPLIAPELLIIAGVAWVLSFAGRRIIRNSEGTRTGESLTSVAWWIAIVVGLGYGTYLLAINFTIRRDADAEVRKWMDSVLKGDHSRAFHRTLEPGRRASIDPDDAAKMRSEFRDPYLMFRQADINRIVERNPGECEFIPGSLSDWNFRQSTIECSYSGTLKCREGTFPMHISLRAVEAAPGSDSAPGRQWQIVPSRGFTIRERILLTPYGWSLLSLEKSADDMIRRFHDMNSQGPFKRIEAYTEYSRISNQDEMLRQFQPGAANARLAALGGLASTWTIPPAVFKYTADRFFSLPGAQKPSKAQDQEFLSLWQTSGIGMPGGRLLESPDMHNRVVITDNYVEIHMPVELPMTLAGDPMAMVAARGRLVFVCSDPTVKDELKKLREAADPNAGTAYPPANIRHSYPWRLDRLETDLTKVILKPQSMPAAGPTP